MWLHDVHEMIYICYTCVFAMFVTMPMMMKMCDVSRGDKSNRKEFWTGSSTQSRFCVLDNSHNAAHDISQCT